MLLLSNVYSYRYICLMYHAVVTGLGEEKNVACKPSVSN